MIAVYIVIGFIAGALLLFFLMRLQQVKLSYQNTTLTEEKNRVIDENNKLITDNSKYLSENKELLQENSMLKVRVETDKSVLDELKGNFERERLSLEKQRIDAESYAEKLRKESDEQWQLKFDKLKEEFQNIATGLLEEKQSSLQQTNRQQLGEILKPIQEQFNAFRKSVEESKTSTEVAKRELKDSFESTLRLFAQQQNRAVEALKTETVRIGNDANNLTNALKRDTKKQGNWGELILESLLESSGLEKDVHYFIQESIRDEEGNIKRPDVIVRFPEGRSVIIDSKVSLTAYTEAFQSDEEEFRRKRFKDHAKSVRKHVDELSVKNYEKLNKDNIGFIRMFIPNDQCYLTAIEEDRDISRYAYEKGIVIISPSNLMMALQLAFNMWQQYTRNKSLDDIVQSATDLYDKVSTFSETMEKLENSISNVAKTFNDAKKQLYEGKGNIMRRVESLKSKGITPKKQIKGLEE